MSTPRIERIEDVLTLFMKYRRVITAIVNDDQNNEEALVALLLLQGNGHFALLRHDVFQHSVIKFVKEALLVVPHAQLITHESLDGTPGTIDIYRWGKTKTRLKHKFPRPSV